MKKTLRFLIIERVKISPTAAERGRFAQTALADLEYKHKLERKKKIVAGGPFLDILAGGYVLETETLEELGEILFNSPGNFVMEREVHPLGTFADSLEGMTELSKKRRQ